MRILSEWSWPTQNHRLVLKLERRPQDTWIGVFWKSLWRESESSEPALGTVDTVPAPGPHNPRDWRDENLWTPLVMERYGWAAWICLVPCFPIHIEWREDIGR